MLNKLRVVITSRTATADYIGTFGTTLFMQGLSVVIGIVLARSLGPEGKGQLATVFWLPSLVMSAGILALPQGVAFKVSRQSDRYQEWLTSGFLLSLVLGTAEILVLYPLVPHILGADKQSLVPLTRLYLFYLPAVFCGLTLLCSDQGRQAFAQYNFLRALPVALYFAGIFGLWVLGRLSVGAVVLCNLLTQIMATAIRAGLAWKYLIPGRVLFSSAGKEILRQGVRFHLPALAGLLLSKADMFLLIRLVSDQDIGYYSVAMTIAMVQISMSTSIVQVAFPRVAASQTSESLHQSAQVLLRQFRLAQPLVLGMGALMALLAPFVVRFLYGSQFLPALPIALILVGAMALWGLSNLVDNGLRGMGHGMPGVQANGVGLMALLVSGLLFTRTYGAGGMAIAVLLAQACVLVILLLVFRRLGGSSVKWVRLCGITPASLKEVVGLLGWHHRVSDE
jgi:O-antigen/teichoic acid export membrane protein